MDMSEQIPNYPPPSRSRSTNRAKPQEASPYYARQEPSRRHSRRSKHVRSLQLFNLLLAVALVVVFIGWINTWVNLSGAEKERFELASALRRQSEELNTLRQRNLELSTNVAELVQQRLPSLQALQFDTTLPVNIEYVRNISFTRTGVGDNIRYEYNIVLENLTPDTLTPNIRILLFDETGVQAGGVRITRKASTSNADFDFLEPGEIRAYNAQVPTERHNQPKYFQVYLD